MSTGLRISLQTFVQIEKFVETSPNGVVVRRIGGERRFRFAFDDVNGKRRAGHRVVGAFSRMNRRGKNNFFQMRSVALLLLSLLNFPLEFSFVSQHLFVDLFGRVELE